MKSESGKDIYHKLVAIGDVVVANVTPKAVRSMGIDYESLKQYNPRIISINASGLGDYGCKKDTMIFAPALNCISGFSYTVGYEGEDGVGIGVSTADNIGAAMVAFSILQALAERDATGTGQFIDLAEAENMLCAIGSTITEYSFNQEQTGTTGNHAYYGPLCPHNAYCGAGRDTWMVISVGSDEEWKNLVVELGEEEPRLKAPVFNTYKGRKENEAELDEILGKVVAKHNYRRLADRLQAAGVSAAPVNRTFETLCDEHLNARGFFIPVGLPVNDPRQPDFLITADVPNFEPRENKRYKPAPSLGQDNLYILKEMLNMTDEEIQKAEEDGAFI